MLFSFHNRLVIASYFPNSQVEFIWSNDTNNPINDYQIIIISSSPMVYSLQLYPTQGRRGGTDRWAFLGILTFWQPLGQRGCWQEVSWADWRGTFSILSDDLGIKELHGLCGQVPQHSLFTYPISNRSTNVCEGRGTGFVNSKTLFAYWTIVPWCYWLYLTIDHSRDSILYAHQLSMLSKECLLVRTKNLKLK